MTDFWVVEMIKSQYYVGAKLPFESPANMQNGLTDRQTDRDRKIDRHKQTNELIDRNPNVI